MLLKTSQTSECVLQKMMEAMNWPLGFLGVTIATLMTLNPCGRRASLPSITLPNPTRPAGCRHIIFANIANVQTLLMVCSKPAQRAVTPSVLEYPPSQRATLPTLLRVAQEPLAGPTARASTPAISPDHNPGGLSICSPQGCSSTCRQRPVNHVSKRVVGMPPYNSWRPCSF